MQHRVLNIVVLFVVVALSFGAPSPTRAAVTYPKYLVYVPGTENPIGSPSSAKDLQANYANFSLALSKSARMGAPLTQQIMINYNSGQTRSGGESVGPKVVSSWNSKSTNRLCTNPPPVPRFFFDRALNVAANAYTVAWKLKELQGLLTTSTRKPQFILIGHSQGGMILRMIQLINNGGTALALLPPLYRDRSCWPSFEAGVIRGVVGMGTPLAKDGFCNDVPGAFAKEERAFLDSGAGDAIKTSGKVLMLGAVPHEIVFLGSLVRIPRDCTTKVFNGPATQAAIYSYGMPNPVTSITVSGMTATLTTSGLHNLSVGKKFKLTGSPYNLYNVEWVVESIVGTNQRVVKFSLPNDYYPNQVAMSGFNLQHSYINQDHSWWYTSGKCSAGIMHRVRGDGSPVTPFCGYAELVAKTPNSSWPTTFTPIFSLVDLGNPGTVWDYLAKIARSWYR